MNNFPDDIALGVLVDQVVNLLRSVHKVEALRHAILHIILYRFPVGLKCNEFDAGDLEDLFLYNLATVSLVKLQLLNLYYTCRSFSIEYFFIVAAN